MIEKILIPTDGSNNAEPAVSYALDLAEMTGAEIHVIFVAETEASYILTVGLDDRSLDELEEYGEGVVTEVVDRGAERGIAGKGIIKRGKIASEIVDYANSNDIDQIVMGRQGRGAFEQYLGSNAEKVVRLSEVPVTVVRAD